MAIILKAWIGGFMNKYEVVRKNGETVIVVGCNPQLDGDVFSCEGSKYHYSNSYEKELTAVIPDTDYFVKVEIL